LIIQPKAGEEMAPKKRSLLVALTLLAAFAVACASQGAPSGGESTLSSTDTRGVAPAPAYGPVDGVAQSGGGSTGAQPPAIPVAQAFDTDRALILTASVAMRAKEPWTVSDRVQAITAGLGGDVLSLAQSGSGDQRTATLSIRVPQARFNDALRQIREIGDIEVVSSNVDGKDVTDQFVDLQARLSAKQAEEQRYVALLARANTIDDILKIDQVLSSVRVQIEQLTGQVNSIKARTTYSTINVHVSPLAAAPVPTPDPKAYDPSKTFERALAALSAILRLAVDAAIWGLVFAWIPLLAFAVAFALSRARTRAVPSA
jgi:hypothetical protein